MNERPPTLPIFGRGLRVDDQGVGLGPLQDRIAPPGQMVGRLGIGERERVGRVEVILVLLAARNDGIRKPMVQPFASGPYPAFPLLTENSPAAFRNVLSAARSFVESRPTSQRIITLNAWNEWTEGSYLEPDTTHGMAYLEAIRDVFASPAAVGETSLSPVNGQQL